MTFTYNVWSHWVITWSPTDGVALYIDGALAAQQTSPVSTSEYSKGLIYFGMFYVPTFLSKRKLF